jgi:hypothetical protein
MTKRFLCEGIAGVAIILCLSSCTPPNPPPAPAVAAPAPPPPPVRRQAPANTGDNLFAPSPGDMVQSPGIYVPSPGAPSSQGY